MTGKQILLAFALVLLVATQLAAQPANISIQLRPPTSSGDPRTIEVQPQAAAVCRNTPNCPTVLRYRWLGPQPDAEDERIVIKYHKGLYLKDGAPTLIDANVCFTFPGGAADSITLEHGASKEKELTFKAGEGGCPDKVAYFYDVSCTGGVNGTCGGVKVLDPATMVDNGRRSP